MWWDRLNKTGQIIVVLAVLGVVVWGFVRVESCVRAEPSSSRPTNAPVVTPPISEGSPEVPQPGEDQGGIATVQFRPKPTPDNPSPETQEVKIFIPRDPRSAIPRFTGDTSGILITWTPIRDPYLTVRPEILLGVSVDLSPKASPWLGVSLLRGFGMMTVGAGLDLNGAGPYVGLDIYREFQFGASWRVLPFKGEAQRFSLQLAYRF